MSDHLIADLRYYADRRDLCSVFIGAALERAADEIKRLQLADKQRAQMHVKQAETIERLIAERDNRLSPEIYRALKVDMRNLQAECARLTAELASLRSAFDLEREAANDYGTKLFDCEAERDRLLKAAEDLHDEAASLMNKNDRLRADLKKALSHSQCGCADCHAWKAGLDVPLASAADETDDVHGKVIAEAMMGHNGFIK